MSSSHRVIVCGQSIFAHALEAALMEEGAVDVIRLHPHLPAIVERIVSLRPTLVLVECGETHNDLTIALLTQGVPLVSLDIEAGQGTLFTGRPVALASQPDLARLIRHLTKGPVEVDASLSQFQQPIG
jgi:hypothetical protein